MTAGKAFRGVLEISHQSVLTEPEAGTRYVGGLQWGHGKDYTCLTLLDAGTRRQVFLDRFRSESFQEKREWIIEICQRWQPTLLNAESNNFGEPNVEALRREGLPVRAFIASANSKRIMIDELAWGMESENLFLLNNSVQIEQLQAYEVEQMQAGFLRYSAPEGGRDDTVLALALAWVCIWEKAAHRVGWNPLYGREKRF